MAFTFESILIIVVCIFMATFTALYFYFTRNFKFWHKLGIPYIKPTPFVGNFKDCVFQKTNFGEKLRQIYNEHSDKPYVGVFSIDKPNLVIRDSALLKNILVKDSHNFIDHVITMNEKLDPIFSQGLYLLKGQKWRHLRTKLTPVFSSGKVKMMFYLVDKCGKELADYVDRATVGGSNIEVVELMYRYTIDTIASCAFGIDGHSIENPHAEMWHVVRKVFHFTLRKGLAVLASFSAPAVTSLLNIKYLDEEVNNYLRKTVWSTVEYREKNGVVRNDFLDCIMELRKRGKEEFKERIHSDKNTTIDATFQIDGDIFVAQAFIFLAAGFETSGSTLTWVTYEIAMHPEIQHRLRTEILSVLKEHNGQLTYDGIQEMTYLDMVVSETLRKYPAAPFLDRMCRSDYKLPAPSGNGTVTLPAGTGVLIPALALHRDPKYYPEPDKFDPDRFTEGNKHSRQGYTYMPFGGGPRMCLGMRFGLIQVKTAVCHILSRFVVAPCEDTPRHIDLDPRTYELRPRGDITLSFSRTMS